MKKPVLSTMLCALALLPASKPVAACVGDCSGDGVVTVDEIITGVSIALGAVAVDQCTPIDADGDRRVTVDEIITAVTAALTGCPQSEPRVVALSRAGEIASFDVAAPWTVRASGDLGAIVSSVRCRAGRCAVVHPSPHNAISIVDGTDLSLSDPVQLERGSDPRDVAFIDDDTIVVSQYARAQLLEIDLTTRTTTPVDLSALADADGLPEALRLAVCGRRVFAQLLRVDHDTGAPSEVGAVLAVVDFDRSEGDRVVDADPDAPGMQGIALAARPNFDMPVNCDAGVLYVAEPAPLMQGGGGYEQVDLDALTAADFPIDTGAEVGGFEVIDPDLYWLITHTEFGPGPSSHLNLVGGEVPDTYNTFALEHVNDLALDLDEDLLFYPDPCILVPSNPSCEPGVRVFRARTGAAASEETIDVGFPPIEVVISR